MIVTKDIIGRCSCFPFDLKLNFEVEWNDKERWMRQKAIYKLVQSIKSRSLPPKLKQCYTAGCLTFKESGQEREGAEEEVSTSRSSSTKVQPQVKIPVEFVVPCIGSRLSRQLHPEKVKDRLSPSRR